MRREPIMRANPSDRGAALLLALVVTAIMSALLSGMLLLSVSHLHLTGRNQDYASALNLAEAGINYELQKIIWAPAQYDPSGSPYQQVVSTTGGGQSFSVSTAGDTAGGPWTPPNQAWITATGTVDGVRRTVRVRYSGSFDFFGLYALFSISSSQDPPSMDINGNFYVLGASGTNGGVRFPGGSVDLDGSFWYCGQPIPDSGAVTVDPDFGQVRSTAQPEVFPTVNEEATRRAALPPYNETSPVTVDYFRTHNNNNQIVNSAGDHLISTTKPILDDKALGKTEVITILPGDYYFEEVDLQNARVNVDTASGPVNIWIGPDAGSGKEDVINGNSLLFTGQDVTRFHLYEGSNRTLRMNGTMDFYGCILAYNGPDPDTGAYYGEVELNGTGNITGSVLGYTVTKAHGTADITFQSGGGGNGTPGPFYGVISDWEELNAL